MCFINDVYSLTAANANLWLTNDSILAWATEEDDFSSMDF
jgi:hypothetical protein